MTTLRTLPCKPEEWARIAVTEHSWLHAYKIAKKCGKDFLGQDKMAKNPHAPYWKKVIAWIEKHAPSGQLDDYEEETNPNERGKANEGH